MSPKKKTVKEKPKRSLKADETPSAQHIQTEDIMEKTLKIDAQKLQLLSDRIGQTIEALNLVRFSAMTQPMAQNGIGQWNQFGQNSFFAQNLNPTFGLGLMDGRIQDPRMIDYRTLDGRFVAPIAQNYAPFHQPVATPFYGQNFYGVPFMTPSVYGFGGMQPVVHNPAVPNYGHFSGVNPLAQSWGQYTLMNNPQNYIYGQQPEVLDRTRMTAQMAGAPVYSSTPVA